MKRLTIAEIRAQAWIKLGIDGSNTNPTQKALTEMLVNFGAQVMEVAENKK